MSARMWQYAHGMILLMGILLMVGGIVAGRYGATIVGLIIAAVNLGHWQAWRRWQSAGERNKSE